MKKLKVALWCDCLMPTGLKIFLKSQGEISLVLHKSTETPTYFVGMDFIILAFKGSIEPILAKLRSLRADNRLQSSKFVVFLSGHIMYEDILELMWQDVFTILGFKSTVEEVNTAMTMSLSGYPHFSKDVCVNDVIKGLVDVLRLVPVPTTQRRKELTSRQTQILRMVANGDSNQDIASKLNIDINTVESHRSKIMIRLDLHGEGALEGYTLKEGIVPLSINNGDGRGSAELQ